MSTEQLREVLRRFWGFREFRTHQLEAMQAVLDGRDSLVVLPTGGGKSLCYQAPALCLEGLAVIVSPLISLMKNQVDALRQLGIAAAVFNSSLQPTERRRVVDDIRNGRLRMLYLAPEGLLTSSALELLRSVRISLFAIDEAHCISQWGHDFRPEYRGLRVLRQRFPRVAVHAYTATATPDVRRDIVRQLALSDPVQLVGSFDRPNLIYRVERRTDQLNQICQVLRRHADRPGIIYTLSRKEVDSIAGTLEQLGFRAKPYHAGMTALDRRNNQDAFINEDVNVIVATVAFGMGIDKSNVRYVIHARMPKSIEHYQQESGRAGRDGLGAECVLLHSGADFRAWKSIIEASEAAAQKGSLRALQRISEFCTSSVCRHRALVEHFGQTLESASCGACDICLGDRNSVEDALVVGQKILSCVARLQQRFGSDYTTKVLVGSREKRILGNGHDRLSTWGLLKDESLAIVRDWIEQLVAQKFLRKDGEYRVLNLTETGRQLLRGELTPQLFRPVEKKSESRVVVESWVGVDMGLHDRLVEIRSELARSFGVATDTLLSDVTLRDLARCRPTTARGLRAVHGMGDAKIEQFGDRLTREIAQYCQEHQLSSDVAAESANSRRPLSAAAVESFEYFKRGASVAEVAERMGRAISTVGGYLDRYLQYEGITDPSPWVDRATAKRIEQAVRQIGARKLRPIFDQLQGEVPYELIRIVARCYENRHAVGQEQPPVSPQDGKNRHTRSMPDAPSATIPVAEQD